MHIDESKKYDKRNIERNIKDGIITEKDYGIYFSRLPDISDKLFSLGEDMTDFNELDPKGEDETPTKKKGIKKKAKGKGKTK